MSTIDAIPRFSATSLAVETSPIPATVGWGLGEWNGITGFYDERPIAAHCRR